MDAPRPRRARGVGRRDGLPASPRRSGPRCSTRSTARSSATPRPTSASSPPRARATSPRPTAGRSPPPGSSRWPTCSPGSPARSTASSPPGGTVVIPTPAYPPFFEVVGLGGRRVVEVPLVPDAAGRPGARPRRDRRRAAQRARAPSSCATPRTRPGGCSPSTSSPRWRRSSNATARRVIADEVHAPLVYPGHHHVPYATVSDATAAHTVTVTSASKALEHRGAEVRAGDRDQPIDDAARWRDAPGVRRCPGPTPLGIAASVAAYRDGGPWLARAARLPRRPTAACVGDRARRRGARRLTCAGARGHLPGLARLRGARVSTTRPRSSSTRPASPSTTGRPSAPAREQHVRLNFATSRALLEQILDAMVTAVHAFHPKPQTPPR